MANSYSGFLLTLAAAVGEAGRPGQSALVGANNLIKTVRKDLKPVPAAQYSSIILNYPASTMTVTNLTSGSLTLNNATATPITVDLDKHPTTGFGLPDYDTIRMVDGDPGMAREMFVDEAIKRLLEAINGYLAALITAGNFAQVTSGASGDIVTYAEYLTTWKTLANAKVPVKDSMNMWFVMHPTVFTNTFAQSDFIAASSVGDYLAGQQRMTGVFSRNMGINIDFDHDMPVDTGVYTSLMYHRDALCLAARPPEAESGELGVKQVIAFYDGIPIRISIGYDQLSFTKQLTFDTFVGVKVARAALACRHTST